MRIQRTSRPSVLAVGIIAALLLSLTAGTAEADGLFTFARTRGRLAQPCI